MTEQDSTNNPTPESGAGTGKPIEEDVNSKADTPGQESTADAAPESGEGTGKPIEDNLKSKATWTRLLFIVICCFLISISGFVGTFVVVLGFLWLLITGEVNRQLQQVGQSLASYIYEIVRYLTFNTDDKPFPLGGEWPSGKAGES